MRRVLVLIALLGVMLGLRLLQADAADGARPLVLAAIGFVLLTSFTVAEMGSALTLPRVTGYILTGATLALFGILTPPVVLEMKMFNTLALGLIALGAGLELSVAQLRKVIGTLSATIVSKLAIVVPLVAGTFFLYESYLGPLGLGDGARVGAVAVVMGALSLGTSPAIALAIISETRSRGRLSDIALGAAVLKDLVVVVALAVAVTMARGMLVTDGAAPTSLGHVFVEIGYSLAAGAVLGGLLILYIRYVKAEMLLFVAAMILLVAEVSSLLHLELLLVFIAGGFVVRNLSDYEHELAHPVQVVSLPVFVVFFTIAGASIDLMATWRILPLAIALCVVRGAGYFVAANVGNAVGKETDAVRENAWLAYLPQAGVTLGLVGLAAAQLPGVSTEITSTGMAVVAVNLLLGPVALRAALKRAGEVPSALTTAGAGGSDSGAPDEAVSPVESLPEPLREPFRQIERQLEHHLGETFESQWRRWAANARPGYIELARVVGSDDARAAALWRERRPTLESLEELAEDARGTFVSARAVVRTLPGVVEVPLEPENRQIRPGDALAIRWRKRRAALGRLLRFDRHPVRRVPARELARLHFEPRLAELAAVVWGSRMRLLAGVLEDLEEAARGRLGAEEIEARIERRFEDWEGLVGHDARSVSRRAVASLVAQSKIVDSPYLARSRVRASAADPAVRAALAPLDGAAGWVAAFDASWSRVDATRRLALLRKRSGELLARRALDPSIDAVAQLTDLTSGWSDALVSIGAHGEGTAREVVAARVEEFERVDREIRMAGSERFEQATARFRVALDLRGLTQELAASLGDLPESLVLTQAESPASRAVTVGDVAYRKIDFRAQAERAIVRDAVLAIEQAAERALEAPRGASRTIHSILDSTRVAVRAAAEGADAAVAGEEIASISSTAGADMRREGERLAEAAEEARRAMIFALAERLDALAHQVEREGRTLGELVRGGWLRQVAATLVHRLERAREATARAVTTVERGVRRLLASELRRDVQAKYHSGDVDAASVRAFLTRHAPDRSLSDYAIHFASGPLREPSNFVGHRAVLRRMLEAERSWLAGSGPSSLLLVGEAGSGKSSLLNLLQHGSTAPTVIRPSPMSWRRDVGLLQALSYELGCRPRPGAIQKALEERRSVIVVDDLEQWLPLGMEGLASLERFLELVARTRETTFWAVAAVAPWFELASSATDVSSSFGRIAHLEPVGAAELREMIERRHEASGRALVYPTTALSRWLVRGRPHRDRDIFFALLARASHGNITRALSLWLYMARLDEDGVVRPRLSRALMGGLPFVRSLTPEQVASLALLSRHGPLGDRELATELGCALPLVRRQLAFLLSSGLVDEPGELEGRLCVPRAWAPLLSAELREVSAL